MARIVDPEEPEDSDKTLAAAPVTSRPSPLLSRHLVLAFLALGVLVLGASLAFTIVSNSRADPGPEPYPDPDPDEDWSVVRRSDWKASPPTLVTLLRTPAQYVVVGETAAEDCDTPAHCRAAVRLLQERDLRLSYTDIRHNFLVGGDGTVYEGRGWGVRCPPVHARVQPSLAVALVGSFTHQQPSAAQLDALRALIRVGVRNDYVAANYTLRVDFATSAGNQLIAELTTWPHWSAWS